MRSLWGGRRSSRRAVQLFNVVDVFLLGGKGHAAAVRQEAGIALTGIIALGYEHICHLICWNCRQSAGEGLCPSLNDRIADRLYKKTPSMCAFAVGVS